MQFVDFVQTLQVIDFTLYCCILSQALTQSIPIAMSLGILMQRTNDFRRSEIKADENCDKADRIPCILNTRSDWIGIPVLVLNARDERAIAWLIEQAGFDAVRKACGKIDGNRKRYPSNLAKALGLKIPESVVLTPSADARDRIREMLVLLSSSQR
jgi:hypothetical protein